MRNVTEQHRNLSAQVPQETPPEVPRHLSWRGRKLQLPADGDGPLFHRQYRVDITGATVSPDALFTQIVRDLPHFAPEALAKFKKVKGETAKMRVGDEYDIEILGPWNGSVRVSDVEHNAFTFVTLEGHPEAGQISFRLEPNGLTLRFSILSWARSRDMLVGLGYQQAQVGKEVQKEVWVEFCERVVKASGGEQVGDIEVITEEMPFEEARGARRT
ncbi:DUF1990 family protein [Candidatus Gracilibacteria bacterium]|nr:DUF1990 family protein [Candidatus Gracilibacteria bacterium]